MYPPKIQLKAARVNADLSQEEAAKLLDISKGTLQNYENGTTIPQWDMVKKIGEVYNYPTDFIFFGTDYALSVQSPTATNQQEGRTMKKLPPDSNRKG